MLIFRNRLGPRLIINEAVCAITGEMGDNEAPTEGIEHFLNMPGEECIRMGRYLGDESIND